MRYLFALLIGLGLTQIANLATTVYLHRSLTHRALTLRRGLRIPFRIVIWLTTGIRPRQWVAVHRKHHAYTDEEADPHSPKRLGWLRVQLTNVALYRKEAKNAETVRKYAKDLPQTFWDRVVLDRAIIGLGITVALLIWTLGVWAGILAAAFHFVAYLGLSGAVNSVAHTFGRRPFKNSATNVRWLAILTAGEGLHNNHHAAPTSARFATRWFDVDPGWWFIRLASKVRLATVRHSDVKALAEASAGR